MSSHSSGPKTTEPSSAEAPALAWRIEDELDHALLETIALKELDASQAEAALVELYARHAGFMNEWAQGRRLGTFGPWVTDYVNEVFIRVWQGAATFELPRQTPRPSEEQSRLLVRAWLMTILRNICIDARRGFDRLHSHRAPLDDAFHESLPAAASPEPADQPRPSPRRKTAVEKWMQTLKEHERELAYAIAENYDFSANEARIPEQEVEALCRKYGIGRTSMNVYKQRLLKSLKKAIVNHETSCITS